MELVQLLCLHIAGCNAAACRFANSFSKQQREEASFSEHWDASGRQQIWSASQLRVSLRHNLTPISAVIDNARQDNDLRAGRIALCGNDNLLVATSDRRQLAM